MKNKRLNRLYKKKIKNQALSNSFVDDKNKLQLDDVIVNDAMLKDALKNIKLNLTDQDVVMVGLALFLFAMLNKK
jgi:hypothetical protein